ncbi:MAG: response regulator [Desulfamplus sp.]|nr:response regulator [Desulfamplus sp.]
MSDVLKCTDSLLMNKTLAIIKLAVDFINLPIDEVDSAITRAMGKMGKLVNADRVYVFDYDMDRQIAVNTHEWYDEGLESLIDGLQADSLDSRADWFEPHQRGETIHIPDVTALPAHSEQRRILEAQGVKSMIAVPMMHGGRCLGFCGFDSVREYNSYTAIEKNVLSVFAVMLTNIKQRRRIEEELRAGRERFDLAIRGSNDGIYDWDICKNTLYLSPRWKEQLGYADHELTNEYKTFEERLHPEDKDMVIDTLQQNLQGIHKLSALEFRMRHKNGSYRWILSRGEIIRDRTGTPRRMAGSNTDITEQRRAEENMANLIDEMEMKNLVLDNALVKARSAVRAKSEFLANMSHEIRTPLNGVIGMTGLLMDTRLTDEQLRYAEAIESSGISLLGLINDILDFSKIEAGKLDMETLDFDLQSLMEEFSDTMALRAHEKGLEFIPFIYPDVPHILRGDPGRLRQILTNLAGNAVKFTEHGEVVVKVSLEGREPGGVLLRFTVQDTGIGIPEDKINLLFDKFSQADASITRKFGGTGLGLAISKQLAEMMGGTAGVKSVEGQGSTFWFTAMFAVQERAEEDAPVPIIDSLKGLKVLVVDDNAMGLEILARQLTAWGMETETAHCGHRALEILESSHGPGRGFNLGILDFQMPDMDGGELGKRIKADSRFKSIPLVMLTSLGRPGDAGMCAKLGFAAYLNKPVRQSELYDTLALVIARGRAGYPFQEMDNTVQVSRGRTDSPFQEIYHTMKYCSRSKIEPMGDHIDDMDHNIQGSSRPPIITRHMARENKRAWLSRCRFSGRILVVEDNITNQQVAQGILKKMGLAVDVAANGKEAIQAMELFPYDLIFMDVMMPEMDGLEATRKIRIMESRKLGQRERKIDMSIGADVSIGKFIGADMSIGKFRETEYHPRVPVIAMTAGAMIEDRQRCFDAGMDDYISKPVEPCKLVHALEKWLPGNKPTTAPDTAQNNTDADQSAVFDSGSFMERIMGNEDLFIKLIGIFLETLPQHIKKLQDALDTEDVPAACMQAHSVKGMASNVSARVLYLTALEMENQAKEGNLHRVREMMPELMENFETLQQVMKDKL